MVDALVLGTSIERCESSNLSGSTKITINLVITILTVSLHLNTKTNTLSVNSTINISVTMTTGGDILLEGSTWYG